MAKAQLIGAPQINCGPIGGANINVVSNHPMMHPQQQMQQMVANPIQPNMDGTMSVQQVQSINPQHQQQLLVNGSRAMLNQQPQQQQQQNQQPQQPHEHQLLQQQLQMNQMQQQQRIVQQHAPQQQQSQIQSQPQQQQQQQQIGYQNYNAYHDYGNRYGWTGRSRYYFLLIRLK